MSEIHLKDKQTSQVISNHYLVINDSEESSFNFAEKLAEADMQAFY